MAETRTARRLPEGFGWWLTPAVTAGIGAIAISASRPFVSNQNIYLLHSVGAQTDTLEGDWMLGTADSFPLFSAGSSVVYRFGGEVGLMLASSLTAACALVGVFLIASRVGGFGSVGRRTAMLTTLLVAAVHSVAWRQFGDPDISSFGGLGGQYLFVGPAYLQPASFGCLMVLALGIRLHAGGRISHRSAMIASSGLVALSCAIHPGYLLPTFVASASIGVAALTTWRDRSLAIQCAVTPVLSALAVLATSPVARGQLGNRNTAALDYLAFVRIPHHTIWTNWSHRDPWLVIAILLACLVARRIFGNWGPSVSLATALGVSALTALWVEWSRNATLAIGAPWRVSVFLVPVSVTILGAALCAIVVRRMGSAAVAPAAIVLAAMGVSSGLLNAHDRPDPAERTPVRLVAAAEPEGVGFIPLELSDVRLNAGYPIFVDWKSHPHAVDDLEEWIRRIELSRAARTDERSFCAFIASEDIGWVLAPSDQPPHRCVADWSTRSEGAWQMLVRPVTT